MITGIFPGKFCPLHKGHIHSIMEASKLVDELFVIVSYRDDPTITRFNGVHITEEMIVKWLLYEVGYYTNIHIKSIDETNIVPYPNGWEPWSKLVKDVVPFINFKESIIFGNELEYLIGYTQYFSPKKYIILDPSKSSYKVCSTDIRKNVYDHLDYIPQIVEDDILQPGVPILYLIRGLPGSGKTTYCNQLHCAVISPSDFSSMVGGNYKWIASNYMKSKVGWRQVVEDIMIMRCDLAISELMPEKKYINFWLRLAKKYYYKVVIKTLIVTPEESYTRNIHNVPYDDILEVHNQFDYSIPDQIIDFSNPEENYLIN